MILFFLNPYASITTEKILEYDEYKNAKKQEIKNVNICGIIDMKFKISNLKAS